MTEQERFTIKTDGVTGKKAVWEGDKLFKFADDRKCIEQLVVLLNRFYNKNKELKGCIAHNSYLENTRLKKENQTKKDILTTIRVNIETVDKENTEDLKTTIKLIEAILQTRGAI